MVGVHQGVGRGGPVEKSEMVRVRVGIRIRVGIRVGVGVRVRTRRACRGARGAPRP